MRTITQEELDKIVEQHQHWIKEDCEGWEDMKANLKGANLKGANLAGAILAGAILTRANLEDANLTRANLTRAILEGAILTRANLTRAILTRAILEDAILTRAILEDAILEGADKFRLGKVLDEPLTGYKRTKEGVVITAEIPAGAIVFCINGSKCRTNRAKITDMAGKELLHSSYDPKFEYRLGQEIKIENFNLMYNVECASGFHFFRTRDEAENYNG